MKLEIYDLAKVPLFNENLLHDQPEPVRDFEVYLAAGAVLIATPEYNFSIPGVLKNALDWAWRPPETSPLNDKSVPVMGASTSFYGTVLAQMHLRQVFAYTSMHRGFEMYS